MAIAGVKSSGASRSLRREAITALPQKAMPFAPPPQDFSALIQDIVETAQQRRALLIAEGDMTRRIKAKERQAALHRHRLRGLPRPAGKFKFPPVAAEDSALVFKFYPAFYEARLPLTAQRKETEKALLGLAARLPCAAWCKTVPGFGLLSLATIVGSAGDLANYPDKSKLWKRMGMAVIDGRSQRRVKDTEGAARQGYAPARRAEIFVIGDNLLRAKNPEYRAVYDARKAHEIARAEAAGLKIVPAAKIPKARAAEFMSEGHIHRRAKRYIEKRLLKKLWQAWRAATKNLPSTASLSMPPAGLSAA